MFSFNDSMVLRLIVVRKIRMIYVIQNNLRVSGRLLLSGFIGDVPNTAVAARN